MSDNKQTLALSTKRERPAVRIDGVDYDLLSTADLRLKDALWLEKAAPKIGKLAVQVQGDDCPEDVADRLSELVLHVSDIILANVPAAVRGRLTDMQKLAVIQAYMQGLEKEARASPFPGAGGAAQGNGSLSSPGSSGSTGGPAEPGSG